MKPQVNEYARSILIFSLIIQTSNLKRVYMNHIGCAERLMEARVEKRTAEYAALLAL